MPLRNTSKRGLLLVAVALLLLLLVADLIRPDSILRSLLGLGDGGGPRETLRRFMNSVRDGEIWPGPR